MTSDRQTLTRNLVLPSKPSAFRGKIIVKGDTVVESNDEIHFRARASLTNSMAWPCLCSSDNPYLLV